MKLLTIFRYRIRELQKKTEGIFVREALSEDFLSSFLPQGEFVIKDSKLAVDLHLLIHEKDYVGCQGVIQGFLQTSCYRCLAPAQLVVDCPIQVLFLHRWEEEKPVKGSQKQRDKDDIQLENLSSNSVKNDTGVDIAYHDGEFVDLTSFLQEQILLSFPLQIICKEDCLGICQKCGISRNEKACECNQNELESFRLKLGRIIKA